MYICGSKVITEMNKHYLAPETECVELGLEKDFLQGSILSSKKGYTSKDDEEWS